MAYWMACIFTNKLMSHKCNGSLYLILRVKCGILRITILQKWANKPYEEKQCMDDVMG